MRKKKNTFSGLAFKSMTTNNVFFPRSRIYKRRHHRVFYQLRVEYEFAY